MFSFSMIPTLAWFNFSPMELLIIGVIMLLLFGRRLPEVGKSLGKGIVEFKKGLKGVEDEMNQQPPQPPQQQQWGQQPAAQIPQAPYAQPAPQQYAEPVQQANPYAPPAGPPNTVSRAEPAH